MCKLKLFEDTVNCCGQAAILCFIQYICTCSILAPDRAPLNIQWSMIGSTLSLHWDPVVALESESKVTGYLVGPD